MSTIPASEVVSINPGVLSTGGGALALLGMFLTTNSRVPVGTVKSFAGPTNENVLEFFGPSNEATQAAVYFQGYDNKTQTPGALNFVRFPLFQANAYLQGGNISGLTIPQLQAIDGTLTVLMDGYTYSGSVNLTSATSFSAAAADIETALNGSLPGGGSFTGSVAAETFACTASIAGQVMTVTAVASGIIYTGTLISSGAAAGTQVGNQISGTLGGIGTYSVSISQTVASTTIDGTYGLLTITAVSSGTLAVGQSVSGTDVADGSAITALGNGSGGNGTYILNNTASAISTTITTTAPDLAVIYDSVSGAFQISSGSTGVVSTAAFATTNATATALGLTQATGAYLSQGAVVQTPSTFMSALVNISQNWANFTTLFDPDGASGGFTQKLQFAAWTSLQSNRYCYVAWDTSILATQSVPSTNSFGYALQQANYSGTNPNYQPSDLSIASFVCGMAASINFNLPDGRITAAFKSQTGLIAGVTDPQIAVNLAGNPQTAGDFGNGYNFYGAYATADSEWVYYTRGTVSGPFKWLDTYWNQIWLNNYFLVVLMDFLTSVNSVPYNQAGYSAIRVVLQGPISQALNAGVIRSGVTLSSSQIAQLNAVAPNAASTVQNQGWFLQIAPPPANVRQSRGSPTITFYYADGESIQAISFASIVVQ